MTEKEMRRLSRADLLEMLIDQSKELQETQKSLQRAEAELNKRNIAIAESGSIADAALRLNGVFEAAQAACGQYIENIHLLSSRQDEICRQRDAESLKKAEALLAETERRCSAMEEETKEKCLKMLEKARADSEAFWKSISRKLEAFCAEHAEVRELLQIPVED